VKNNFRNIIWRKNKDFGANLKMNSQKATQGGGLWNTNRPVISSDTQNLLKSKLKR